jgi:hypothetical protein
VPTAQGGSWLSTDSPVILLAVGCAGDATVSGHVGRYRRRLTTLRVCVAFRHEAPARCVNPKSKPIGLTQINAEIVHWVTDTQAEGACQPDAGPPRGDPNVEEARANC